METHWTINRRYLQQMYMPHITTTYFISCCDLVSFSSSSSSWRMRASFSSTRLDQDFSLLRKRACASSSHSFRIRFTSDCEYFSTCDETPQSSVRRTRMVRIDTDASPTSTIRVMNKVRSSQRGVRTTTRTQRSHHDHQDDDQTIFVWTSPLMTKVGIRTGKLHQPLMITVPPVARTQHKLATRRDCVKSTLTAISSARYV